MEAWKTSPLKQDLLRVVTAMGKSCANPTSQFEYNSQKPLEGLSPAMASLHGSLTQMLRWLEDDIPPIQDTASAPTAIRFGNPAFRQWHARLKERGLAIVKEMFLVHQESRTSSLSVSSEVASERGRQAAGAGASSSPFIRTEGDPPFLLELASYLLDAFGHPVRLDYGTGHESSFMVFLYATCKLGWMDQTAQANEPPSMEKLKAATLSIFTAYLQVTRQLQLKYRLEPAGSHGVWGLDDYHCLPFYFGACQCQQQTSPSGIIDEMPQPKHITEESCRKRYSQNLLYFGCMDYICTLKSGAPLFECSPMLYDISQTCPTWTKVASGLIKLYEGEVLNKRQVVQHFTFGSNLFVATWKPSKASPEEPPTTNFRTPIGPVGPMVRAPWATVDAENLTQEPKGTERAPWAVKEGEADESNPQQLTKAPWAK